MIKKDIWYQDNEENNCKGIFINDDIYIATLFDIKDEVAGEIKFYINGSEVILSSIYCKQRSRSTGVGQTLLDIMESCVKNKSRVITGYFHPYQEDDDYKAFGKDPNLVINSRKFYEKNNYKMLTYSEYLAKLEYDEEIRIYKEKIKENKGYKYFEKPKILFKKTNQIQRKRFEYYGDLLVDMNIIR